MELRSILALRRVFRTEKIDQVLSFTPKGNIYSSFAAVALPIRLILTVSGLGRVFAGMSWLRYPMKVLYRLALARAYRVLFENEDDRRFLIDCGDVDAAKAERIPGLGIDLAKFALPERVDVDHEGPIFLLLARLIWEKGLAQYVGAARAIRVLHPSARFLIAGIPEKDNPSAIPKETLDEWVQSGAVEYLGAVDDVRPYLDVADCIVLPSYYREGVPHSLMEAAAMAKPIVTTDTPGCRDTVDDGVTGYLCRPQDVDDLIAALKKFIALPAAERRTMGQRGREKMETSFDETFVIRRYLDLVSQNAF